MTTRTASISMSSRIFQNVQGTYARRIANKGVVPKWKLKCDSGEGDSIGDGRGS